jgi:hypothetical protein
MKRRKEGKAEKTQRDETWGDNAITWRKILKERERKEMRRVAGRHSGQLVTSIGATLIAHITHGRQAPYQRRAQTKTMQRKPTTTALRATGAVMHTY